MYLSKPRFRYTGWRVRILSRHSFTTPFLIVSSMRYRSSVPLRTRSHSFVFRTPIGAKHFGLQLPWISPRPSGCTCRICSASVNSSFLWYFFLVYCVHYFVVMFFACLGVLVILCAYFRPHIISHICCCIVKVHDFGLAIRAHNIKQIIPALLFMLKIFLLTNCKDYKYGTLAALLVLYHLRESKHPVFETLELFPGMLNEEPGEISLSVLARLQTSAKVRCNRELMSANYQLIPRLSSITATMDAICGISLTSGYKRIKPGGPDVSAASAFFLKVIRDLKAKQFRHYTGDPNSWKSLQDALKTAANVAPEPYLRPTKHLLEGTYAKWRTQMKQRWVRDDVVALLPGFEHLVRSDDSKERKEPLPPSDDDDDDDLKHGWSDDEAPPLVRPPMPGTTCGPPLPGISVPPAMPQEDKKGPAPNVAPPAVPGAEAKRGRRRGRPRRAEGASRSTTIVADKKQRSSEPPPIAVQPAAPSLSQAGRPRRRGAPRPGFFEETRGWVFS